MSKQVYAAINEVQSDLAKEGISKDKKNAQQGYSFRGIDDVYNAIAPLLAKHKLCILPRMVKREVIERQSKNGGAIFYVSVEAEFDFVSAIDGSAHTVRTFGEAMDSGDKATNKAMSAAYKYAAFQTFAIPTEETAQDADSVTHVVAPKSAKSVAQDTHDKLSEEAQDYVKSVAMDVLACLPDEEAMFDAYNAAKAKFDTDEQVAFWKYFDSKSRSSLKKIGESRKQK